MAGRGHALRDLARRCGGRGTLVVLLGAAGCGTPAPSTTPVLADEPSVVNERWRILKMATAHGVFTIEVEVTDLETAAEVATDLIDPLRARYAEVLVYVYADGEGEGGNPPSFRIQWTEATGFVETAY